MARKPSHKSLKALTGELLDLQAAVERYREVETLLKEGMQQINFGEIVTDRGRVFISVSERVLVTPALAREVLPGELAQKIIQVKENVPNDLIKAFVQVGEISEAQRERLMAGAEKTPVVSLHVRPLK
jgi:hypothetical protein